MRRIAGLVSASFLALGLIAVVALLVFGQDAVVTFIEKFALIIAIFVLPVVLGGLLIGLGHRFPFSFSCHIDRRAAAFA